MNRAASLIAAAKSATSLDDFGEDSFREGLERLVQSADTEARFNDDGRAAFDWQVVDLLSTRLQVEHWYRLHPEMDEQTIDQPLIGLGLPRTGSTALSCMLAEDPATQFIRTWESLRPCPPPVAETQHTDPRIAETEASLLVRDQLYPRLGVMVPNTATGPIECQHFMALDFKSQMFQASAWLPSYVDWLNHAADLVPTYRYVKRVLKLLQWRCPPRRWRLKNPSHSLFIEALVQVFPDAKFWMTHRDIASVVPSVADLYLELQRPFTAQVDMPELGRMTADFCELGMQRMIAFRDAGNDDRFFDIQFAAFQSDPMPILADLYAFLGEELTEEAHALMQAWTGDRAHERESIQRNAAAAFGLDPARLRGQFAFYTRRFNVPAALAA